MENDVGIFRVLVMIDTAPGVRESQWIEVDATTANRYANGDPNWHRPEFVPRASWFDRLWSRLRF